ncbi:hypothetical protein Tco_0133977 [Tanacetum coccineum]
MVVVTGDDIGGITVVVMVSGSRAEVDGWDGGDCVANLAGSGCRRKPTTKEFFSMDWESYHFNDNQASFEKDMEDYPKGVD